MSGIGLNSLGGVGTALAGLRLPRLFKADSQAQKLVRPASKRHKRIIQALAVLDIGLLGLIGGLAFWLAMKAPDTENALKAKIPFQMVTVEKPAPPPAPPPPVPGDSA